MVPNRIAVARRTSVMRVCRHPAAPPRVAVRAPCLFFLFATVLAPRVVAAAGAPERPAAQVRLLPADDLFVPLVADMKQPRFFAGMRSMDFRGTSLPDSYRSQRINGGLVGFGGDLGLVTVRGGPDGRDGIQLALSAGVFSQFNLSVGSADLINSDFIAGFPITARHGPWSARLRGYHQSSHLGDEFMMHNPAFERLDISFEAADLVLSYEGSFWRLYGGGGLLVSTNTALEPGLAQGGVELRGPAWPVELIGNAALSPVAAVDFGWFQARGLVGTASVKAGVESTSPDAHRQFRVLLVYLRGYLAYGQFFDRERVEDFGLELQFDY